MQLNFSICQLINMQLNLIDCQLQYIDDNLIIVFKYSIYIQLNLVLYYCMLSLTVC